jgi:hypothetical protein
MAGFVLLFMHRKQFILPFKNISNNNYYDKSVVINFGPCIYLVKVSGVDSTKEDEIEVVDDSILSQKKKKIEFVVNHY